MSVSAAVRISAMQPSSSLLQAVQQRTAANVRELRAGEDDRSFGSGDCRENRIGNRLCERGRRHGGPAPVRPDDGVALDPLLEKIRWQAQVYRARAPGRGDSDRLGDIVAQSCRGARRPGCLGDGSRHLGLADFLEAAAPELPCGRVPREQHHRRLRPARGEQSADRIGVAGPAGDKRDPRLAGEPSPRISHVDRSRLVAHMHEIEIGLERCIKDRHDVIAGKRKHTPAAEASKRLRNDVGASKRLGHRVSFLDACAALRHGR
jgi:hypothetical protein